MDEDAQVIEKLNEARDYGFAHVESLPQVVKQILNFVANPSLAVKAWCAKFLKDVFVDSPSSLLAAVKTELALDSLPYVVQLSNVRDAGVFSDAINISIVVYKLAFRYVGENDGGNMIWQNVVELRNNLVAKFDTQFPFESSFDTEHDEVRNIHAKVELLKFLMTVIDYQLRSSSNKFYLIARVNPDHSQMKHSLMETEASALIDVVLKPLQNDILVTPLVTATLNHLSTIVRRKRQFVERIIAALEALDTEAKCQSNYESVETFKLSKKYIDRTLRILLTYMTKSQAVPPSLASAVNRKIALLTSRGDDVRRKNIIQPNSSDAKIMKRPFEGFRNSNKRLKSLDYKSLYALTDLNSEISNFDISSLPQNILVSMSLNALNRASIVKLTKALDIVSARYESAVKDLALTETVKVQKFNEEEDEDGTGQQAFEEEIKYSLPPPQLLSIEQKREHIKLIVNNFIELASKGGSRETTPDVANESGLSELTKVVVRSWQPETWSILLTRLATRGMGTYELQEPKSADNASNEDLSDIIRKALFDYFLASIHERIDVAIEWLNEEWYSESVFNEQKQRDVVSEKWYEKYSKNQEDVDDIEEEIRKELESTPIETPTYNKWAQQVLDALIPFLEPTDRKIFLRMMSDLPALTKEMVAGIKSLCADPARSKLGFLSLQYLIMYRPPAKDFCLDVLRDMAGGDQEDLKEEAEKLLQKYA